MEPAPLGVVGPVAGVEGFGVEGFGVAGAFAPGTLIRCPTKMSPALASRFAARSLVSDNPYRLAIPLIVSPARTTWMTVAVVLAGRAAAGVDVADLVGVADGRPGTSSFCPGWISAPPPASRFFSTIPWIVVWLAMARCQSVS